MDFKGFGTAAGAAAGLPQACRRPAEAEPVQWIPSKNLWNQVCRRPTEGGGSEQPQPLTAPVLQAHPMDSWS